jgi:hypothetical protein
LALATTTLAQTAPAPTAAPTGKKPDPTKQQTEEWLREHVEAWNHGDITVTVKDCRVLVQDTDRQRSEIVDLKGLILPIEVISLTGPDATIRLRVKQKHTGTYAMYRSCDASNRYCQEPTGKFQAMPWIDLTVTAVRDFLPGRRTTDDKAVRLEAALEHYARLCGAMEDARNRLF